MLIGNLRTHIRSSIASLFYLRLYAAASEQFIEDTVTKKISEKLKRSYARNFGWLPSHNEVASWENSLRPLASMFRHAGFVNQGVVLELRLPLSNKRLDCLICGRDSAGDDNAVVIELKQWERCEAATGENEVIVWMAGTNREVLHPSVQAGGYKMYLEDTHSVFHDQSNPIKLNACAYLHNYRRNSSDTLNSEKFKEALTKWPLFFADDFREMEYFLVPKLKLGNGIEILKRIDESKYRPSKKLMDHVHNVIKGKKEYILIDEQQVVYDKILSLAQKGLEAEKTVVIVKGGPGTGKSVIAINLMADLLGNGYNAHYATGSRAFTETLKRLIGPRSLPQFRYFNSYGDAMYNEVDVIIGDEAHRLWKTDQSRWTPKNKRSSIPLIEKIFNAARLCVFFIDDYQIVRPNEIGSVQYIKEYASKNNLQLFEYELEVQFRCGGSDAFVNWINNTLQIKETANDIWYGQEGFDFKILDDPKDVENAIRDKVGAGNTGRMTAGFCWEWSIPNLDGSLKNDVVIGNYRRPWNAKPDAGRLAAGIPKSNLWAHEPKGIDQIGCIYTAQGFEFDYVGVIFGNDLVYDPVTKSWKGIPENSADNVVRRSKSTFLEHVKNSYRVLLSRGMKGCYVFFVDKQTEEFFKSRMKTRELDLDLLNSS